MYLLDTDICIYLVKNKSDALIAKLKAAGNENVFVSSVTVAELSYSIAKSEQRIKNREALFKFLSPFEIIPFTEIDAEYYGGIRSNLEKAGTPIGPYDLQIAAQAISRSLTLVSNNEREFSRIKNLKLENWAV